MPDAIVLGLDGANWALLEPWLDEGHLPNIQSLRDSGIDADLESCLPPVTCPNWRCYSTGKNPGKLGVYWWEKIDTDARTLSTPNSRSFRSADYWHYLNEEGLTTGVFNLPMTYPPSDVDGYMVAGGPGSEQKDYACPASLEEELGTEDYRLHPEATVTSKDDYDAAEELVELIDYRLRKFRRLLEERPTDLAHCTVFYVNVLQHYFWRDDPTKAAWGVIDEHIGAIRESHPDATLYLMSDHGCAEIDTMFYANAWLEQEGYLGTRRDATAAVGRLGIDRQRLSKWTARFGVRSLLAAVVPDAVLNLVPQDEQGAKREQKMNRVRWEESRALASGQGLVYVFEDGAVPAVVTDLEALRREDSEAVAAAVHRREEAYEGPYVDEAPEIVFEQARGVHTSGAIGDNPVFEKVSHWRAENVRTGLFLADGPAVEGSVDDPLSITDVAPTLLYGSGCAVPKDMDGTPLELFDRGHPQFREPLSLEHVGGRSDEAVKERLEDLGYLQ